MSHHSTSVGHVLQTTCFRYIELYIYICILHTVSKSGSRGDVHGDGVPQLLPDNIGVLHIPDSNLTSGSMANWLCWLVRLTAHGPALRQGPTHNHHQDEATAEGATQGAKTRAGNMRLAQAYIRRRPAANHEHCLNQGKHPLLLPFLPYPQ